ncbi:MAG: hypothetical protein LBL32_01115 [Holosporales bacterium]|jgi:hypothetical protein|nr:hypothetical protein [Holosporales bacterium]
MKNVAKLSFLLLAAIFLHKSLYLAASDLPTPKESSEMVLLDVKFTPDKLQSSVDPNIQQYYNGLGAPVPESSHGKDITRGLEATFEAKSFPTKGSVKSKPRTKATKRPHSRRSLASSTTTETYPGANIDERDFQLARVELSSAIYTTDDANLESNLGIAIDKANQCLQKWDELGKVNPKKAADLTRERLAIESQKSTLEILYGLVREPDKDKLISSLNSNLRRLEEHARVYGGIIGNILAVLQNKCKTEE